MTQKTIKPFKEALKEYLPSYEKTIGAVMPDEKTMKMITPSYENTLKASIPEKVLAAAMPSDKVLQSFIPSFENTILPVLPDEKTMKTLFPSPAPKVSKASCVATAAPAKAKFPECSTVTFKIEKKMEPHPYLKAVKPEHAFKLKSDHNSMLAEVVMLEHLHEEIKKAPEDAVVFHMQGKNDFASWIKDCVGDWWLGSRVEKIELGDPGVTKFKLMKTIEDRIGRLKNC